MGGGIWVGWTGEGICWGWGYGGQGVWENGGEEFNWGGVVEWGHGTERESGSEKGGVGCVMKSDW